jgi:hypothetical protein
MFRAIIAPVIPIIIPCRIMESVDWFAWLLAEESSASEFA